jgi:hypothetical protein
MPKGFCGEIPGFCAGAIEEKRINVVTYRETGEGSMKIWLDG